MFGVVALAPRRVDAALVHRDFSRGAMMTNRPRKNRDAASRFGFVVSGRSIVAPACSISQFTAGASSARCSRSLPQPNAPPNSWPRDIMQTESKMFQVS
jgi:hypothetical protein